MSAMDRLHFSMSVSRLRQTMVAVLLSASVAVVSCSSQQAEQAEPEKPRIEANDPMMRAADESSPVGQASNLPIGEESQAGSSRHGAEPTATRPKQSDAEQDNSSGAGIATFGAGCFWCVEAVFQQVNGVLSVESGYCGGSVENPTYRQICEGNTGHAEVCQIRYDPSKITFDELLEIFWKTHDPTTLNRQGNDIGTQYRSVVFYHNQQQKLLAEQRRQQLDAAGVWREPVVTEISPSTKFYKAEDYHQNYYRDNPSEGYCRFIIQPKVEKFRAVFKDRVKKGDG